MALNGYILNAGNNYFQYKDGKVGLGSTHNRITGAYKEYVEATKSLGKTPVSESNFAADPARYYEGADRELRPTLYADRPTYTPPGATTAAPVAPEIPVEVPVTTPVTPVAPPVTPPVTPPVAPPIAPPIAPVVSPVAPEVPQPPTTPPVVNAPAAPVVSDWEKKYQELQTSMDKKYSDLAASFDTYKQNRYDTDADKEALAGEKWVPGSPWDKDLYTAQPPETPKAPYVREDYTSSITKPPTGQTAGNWWSTQYGGTNPDGTKKTPFTTPEAQQQTGAAQFNPWMENAPYQYNYANNMTQGRGTTGQSWGGFTQGFPGQAQTNQGAQTPSGGQQHPGYDTDSYGNLSVYDESGNVTGGGVNFNMPDQGQGMSPSDPRYGPPSGPTGKTKTTWNGGPSLADTVGAYKPTGMDNNGMVSSGYYNAPGSISTADQVSYRGPSQYDQGFKDYMGQQQYSGGPSLAGQSQGYGNQQLSGPSLAGSNGIQSSGTRLASSGPPSAGGATDLGDGWFQTGAEGHVYRHNPSTGEWLYNRNGSWIPVEMGNGGSTWTEDGVQYRVSNNKLQVFKNGNWLDEAGPDDVNLDETKQARDQAGMYYGTGNMYERYGPMGEDYGAQSRQFMPGYNLPQEAERRYGMGAQYEDYLPQAFQQVTQGMPNAPNMPQWSGQGLAQPGQYGFNAPGNMAFNQNQAGTYTTPYSEFAEQGLGGTAPSGSTMGQMYGEINPNLADRPSAIYGQQGLRDDLQTAATSPDRTMITENRVSDSIYDMISRLSGSQGSGDLTSQIQQQMAGAIAPQDAYNQTVRDQQVADATRDLGDQEKKAMDDVKAYFSQYNLSGSSAELNKMEEIKDQFIKRNEDARRYIDLQTSQRAMDLESQRILQLTSALSAVGAGDRGALGLGLGLMGSQQQGVGDEYSRLLSALNESRGAYDVDANRRIGTLSNLAQTGMGALDRSADTARWGAAYGDQTGATQRANALSDYAMGRQEGQDQYGMDQQNFANLQQILGLTGNLYDQFRGQGYNQMRLNAEDLSNIAGDWGQRSSQRAAEQQGWLGTALNAANSGASTMFPKGFQ